jgi:hypothetical protein
VFVYQTPTGFDAMCAAGDLEDASRLYELSDGRRLILPLCHRKGVPSWLCVERSPAVGSLISDGPVGAPELRAVFDDLASLPALRVVVRPTAMAGTAWEAALPDRIARIPLRSHVLDLEGGFDVVWKERFNSQARRAVRKAEKAGLEVVREPGARLIEEFYELYRPSIDRWAKQRGHPRLLARWRAARTNSAEDLKRKMAALGDACRVWMARVEGRPAAGIVILQGANAHYTLGAMDKDLAGPTRATFLLQKMAIEEACAAGCGVYNMGETGTSESLARFKSHFGAVAFEHQEYRVERLPLTRAERGLRRVVKRVTAFRSSNGTE